MQKPTKYYFLAPSDILPNTTLQLGQLFTSLQHPDRRLCPPPPIPPSQIQPIQSSSPWDWSYDISSSVACNLSVTASALAQIGPDISASVRKGARIEFSAERLETVQFNPDKTYLDSCMALQDVREYLRKRRVSSLYMVTGLKIAYDGVKKEVFSRDKAAHVGVGVDGTGAGVPVAGQVGVGWSRVNEIGQTTSLSGTRVVAIRIDRVLLKWGILRCGDATGETKPVVKGAMMENHLGVVVHGGDEEEGDHHEEVHVLSGYSLDDETVGATEEDFDGVRHRVGRCVEDDGSRECFLVSFGS